MKLDLSRLAGIYHGIGHILDVAHSVGEVAGEVPEPYQGAVKIAADLAGEVARLINTGSSVTSLPPVGSKPVVVPATDKGVSNH